jgi:hypothetical protein
MRVFHNAMLGAAIMAADPSAIAAKMNATERLGPSLMSSPGLSAPVSYIASGIPSYSDLAAYNVNRDGWEAIRQSLFDSNVYAAAGQTQLTFFALPLGQGTGRGGAAKTYSDTNMLQQGQMPANQEFLIQSVEVVFYPTIPYVTADLPAASGNANAAANTDNLINDTWKFYNSGNLTLTIGSKSYLQEGPMLRFPPKAFFELHGAMADTTTAAGTSASRIAFGTARGRPYMLQPANLRLVSNQNFSVTLNWPEGLQTIVNPARVHVILDGILYRRSQ